MCTASGLKTVIYTSFMYLRLFGYIQHYTSFLLSSSSTRTLIYKLFLRERLSRGGAKKCRLSRMFPTTQLVIKCSVWAKLVLYIPIECRQEEPSC